MSEIKEEKVIEDSKKAIKKKASKKVAKKNVGKIEAINNSKLPKADKEAYIKRLEGKKEISNKDISFDTYASIKNFRSGELAGKKALAKSEKKVNMKQKEWDDLFKKF
jgi:hypothetical protein